MVERKTGLGRGLTSLLGENLSYMDFTLNNDSQIKKIPIEIICILKSYRLVNIISVWMGDLILMI